MHCLSPRRRDHEPPSFSSSFTRVPGATKRGGGVEEDDDGLCCSFVLGLPKRETAANPSAMARKPESSATSFFLAASVCLAATRSVTRAAVSRPPSRRGSSWLGAESLQHRLPSSSLAASCGGGSARPRPSNFASFPPPLRLAAVAGWHGLDLLLRLPCALRWMRM